MRGRRSTWLCVVALALTLVLPGAAIGQTDADAYQAFVKHTDAAMVKGVKVVDSLPTDATLKQYRKWFRRLQDWSAKEKRWLKNHRPADCFEEEWGYWHDYVRLLSRGSTMALQGIKRASLDRVGRASEMIVEAGVSYELFVAADSVAACEAATSVTETATIEREDPSSAVPADLGSFDDAVEFMESLGLSGERFDSDHGGDGWGGHSLDPFAMATVSSIDGAVDWVSLTTSFGTTSGRRIAEFSRWFTGGNELGEWIHENLDTVMSESDPIKKAFGDIEAEVSGSSNEDGGGAISVILGLRDEAEEGDHAEASPAASPPRSRGGLVITPGRQDE